MSVSFNLCIKTGKNFCIIIFLCYKIALSIQCGMNYERAVSRIFFHLWCSPYKCSEIEIILLPKYALVKLTFDTVDL
jgi:hypothetical protein